MPATKRIRTSSPSKNVVSKSKTSTKRRVRLPLFKTMVDLGRGFPSRLKTTLKYTEAMQLVCSAGAYNAALYACMGMYDPRYAAGGHQPLYFDQLMTLYNHYVVLASKITVKFSNDAADSEAMRVVLNINDDASLPTYMNTVIEQTPNSRTVITAEGYDRVYTLSKTFDAEKVFGPGFENDPNLQGDASKNPTEAQYYCFCFQTLDEVATGTINCNFEIEYTAVFSELKDVAQS